MNDRVFVSHSHLDKGLADHLVAGLEKQNVNCWVAPRDVTAGRSYAETILTAIEASTALVLIYTTNCNNSPHVIREVERALHLGINIIPVRCDDSTPSKTLDYFLATVHWLSATADNGQVAISRVVPQIMQAVNNTQVLTSSGVKSEQAGKRGPQGQSRRFAIAATAAIVGLCLLGVVIYSAVHSKSATASRSHPIAPLIDTKPSLQPQTATVDQPPDVPQDEPGIYRGKKKELKPAYVEPSP